eukprot:Seg3570.1 transcript_id=Seg3570.1/GoldUCD/mRNA.D3Y31 product="hypothetical protein" protein_id=Seg3570.1/GoldUCD/D3Y31
MSLIRISSRLPLRSCLQTSNAACQRLIKRKENFEGVINAYCYNEKTGFGETHDGNLVLVSKEHTTGGDLSMKTESQFWQEIIEPTSFIDHEALRDELQMHVLSYDDDVIKQDSFSDVTAVHSQPIYKGNIEMKTDEGNCPPGGQTAGFNGGSRTATA